MNHVNICWFADDVPHLPRPAEEHDLPVRARHVPDVRRPHHRVPHLPQAGREANTALLAPAPSAARRRALAGS